MNICAYFNLARSKKEKKRGVGRINLKTMNQSETVPDPEIIISDNSKQRYRLTKGEKNLLIQSLNQYFSQPTFSNGKNDILNNLIQKLSTISQHWNRKNILIWFKNNKDKYFIKKLNADPKSNQDAESYFSLDLDQLNSINKDLQNPTLNQQISPPLHLSNLSMTDKVLQNPTLNQQISSPLHLSNLSTTDKVLQNPTLNLAPL